MGGFEQRADLGLRETSDATADLRDEERQFGMSLCKRNKLINIGGDGLHPTLHRRDAVALPLKAHSLPPNGAKLAISQIRSGVNRSAIVVEIKRGSPIEANPLI